VYATEAIPPPPVVFVQKFGRRCECEGISGVVRVCVSSPPVAPRVPNVAEFLPTPTRPRKSGRLKVVEPSPTPKAVPIAANRAALFPTRDTAEPLHRSHPVGAEVPPNI